MKQTKILRTILEYTTVIDIVTKIVSLSKNTRTQQFRYNVDKSLRLSVLDGLNQSERIYLWLYKTKIHKIMKHNETDFYSQLCRYTSRLKYDGEIKKDLKRTFPNHPEFMNKPKTIEKLRRVLNVFCLQ